MAYFFFCHSRKSGNPLKWHPSFASSFAVADGDSQGREKLFDEQVDSDNW
jgi:hypothetical protein